MATNGVFRTVLSDVTKKGGGGSAVNTAFDNANNEAKKADPKNTKKKK